MSQGIQASYGNIQRAFEGQLDGAAPFKARSLINDVGAVRQIVDVTPAAVNSTAYTFTVNGLTVTYTSDATATVAEIRDGLIAAGRLVQELESVCHFNPSGNNVRVTAVKPGTGFTLAESDANLTTAAVQANVAPVILPFGRAVVLRAAGTGILSGTSAQLPSATGQAFVGVAIRDHSVVPEDVADDGSGGGVGSGKTFNVITHGEVWVYTETAVTANAPAFFRHTAGAGGSVIGRWRLDADTATADAASQCRFLTATSGPGLAKLAVNLPA